MFSHRLCLSAVIGLAVAASTHAAPIRVAQESAPGAGDFDSNVLGYVTPYVTAGPLANYYAYSTVNNVSYGFNAPNNNANTGLTTDRSHLFTVQGSNGLGLFVVHDRPGVANGGGTANTAYTIFGSLVGIPVMDDPGDAYASAIAIGQPQSVIANHAWVSPNTDGLVLSPLTGNWEVLMNFYSPQGGTAFSGLTSWAAYSPDGSPISLVLADGRRVQLRPAAVPEPGTLMAAGTMAVFGLIVRGVRRKRPHDPLPGAADVRLGVSP